MRRVRERRREQDPIQSIRIRIEHLGIPSSGPATVRIGIAHGVHSSRPQCGATCEKSIGIEFGWMASHSSEFEDIRRDSRDLASERQGAGIDIFCFV